MRSTRATGPGWCADSLGSVMSGHRHKVLRRRIGAVVSAILGFLMAASATRVHFEGLVSQDTEYMQNWPILVAVSLAFVTIGGALLFAASKLWRVPESEA